MNNKTIAFLMFALGAAIGSAATWRYIKKKYEQIAQDEIDSVKEIFSKKESDINIKSEGVRIRTKAEQAKDKPSISEYTSKLREQGYTNYSSSSTNNEKEVAKESMDTMKPYVIEPEEFGEADEYEKISLIYYADKILADDNDELLEDINNVVGFDSLTRFGEYEEDSVFVRNDRLKCDYEILLDQRNYMDVITKMPRQVGG